MSSEIPGVDLLKSIDDIEIERELSSRSLAEFMEVGWPYMEPSRPLVRTWSLDAICDHLQAVAEGHITRLIINVPPGSTKSLSACVAFPAWTWTKFPKKKFLYSSYSDSLCRRDSNRCRELVLSEWYKERWPDVKINTKLESSSHRYNLVAGGFRMTASIEGGMTGEHGDVQIVDDPLKPLEVTGSLAISKTALKKAYEWYTQTMSTRLLSYELSARVIIMQRLCEGDLSGMLKETGRYEHLCLPMRFEEARRCATGIGFVDPRKKEGELLYPERVSEAGVEKLEEELGPRGASAQLQQDPVQAEGNIFKAKGIQFYTIRPRVRALIQSWDCAFKGTDKSDYVCGQVWGIFDADYALFDQIHRRMGLYDTIEAIKEMTIRWPNAIAKLIEDKANGPAAEDMLKKTLSGIVMINPRGGKEARANAIEPLWTAGNIWLPDPSIAPWIHKFIKEILGFPAMIHDDQVDSMTQAINYLHEKSIYKLQLAMKMAAGRMR